MNEEIKADIRNKLQAPKTALELLFEGKDVSKKFIGKALGDLEKVVKILNNSSV